MMEYMVGSWVNGKFVVVFTTNNLRMAIIKRRKLETAEKKVSGNQKKGLTNRPIHAIIRIQTGEEMKMTKDTFKAARANDYTAWDLKAPVHFHNRRKMENMFRRKARRNLKIALKKEVA